MLAREDCKGKKEKTYSIFTGYLDLGRVASSTSSYHLVTLLLRASAASTESLFELHSQQKTQPHTLHHLS